MKFLHEIAISRVMERHSRNKPTCEEFSLNCRVLMHGRLVGGVSTIIPGERSCAVCGAQGCWPTRRSCYKCGSMKTASPVQLGTFIIGYKGHFREQSGLGRPSLPLPQPQHLSRWWYLPTLTKSQKRRLNNVLLFLRIKPQLGKAPGTLCSRPLLTSAF